MGLLGDWDSDQAKCADGYWQPHVASDTVAAVAHVFVPSYRHMYRPLPTIY